MVVLRCFSLCFFFFFKTGNQRLQIVHWVPQNLPISKKMSFDFFFRYNKRHPVVVTLI